MVKLWLNNAFLLHESFLEYDTASEEDHLQLPPSTPTKPSGGLSYFSVKRLTTSIFFRLQITRYLYLRSSVFLEILHAHLL